MTTPGPAATAPPSGRPETLESTLAVGFVSCASSACALESIRQPEPSLTISPPTSPSGCPWLLVLTIR